MSSVVPFVAPSRLLAPRKRCKAQLLPLPESAIKTYRTRILSRALVDLGPDLAAFQAQQRKEASHS